MQTFAKRILAVALTGALMLPAASAAEAGPRDGWRHGGGWHEGHRPHRGHNRHYHKHKHIHKHKNNNNVGAAIAAGVIGLAAGAIILGATSKPSYAGPPRGPAYPYPRAPYPGPVSGPVGFQPWSPAWYDYCSSKYRSFNPSTGTFTTYSGVQKFCQ
ncbi:BA14K family protein [Roseibium alexandrii]|uniref:BA14K family protein n=1 Tax=Roseibium alexandrii TaxID=388408 RepID=UPI0037534DD0